MSRWYEYPPYIDWTHRITYELKCGHDHEGFYDRNWRTGGFYCQVCRRVCRAVGRRQGWAT